MRALLKFANFLKERKYALADLEQFAELIEPMEHPDGWRGYRMKPLTQTDRVTQRCKVLVHFTWHCRDYVLRILEEHGIANPGEMLNGYIAASPIIQVLSYLANEHKHAGIDAQKQRWAVEIAPRYGTPFVLGQLLQFPHNMKPTLLFWGESFPGVEVTGRAGIGEDVYEFNDFDWRYSCNIEDKDGKPIGDAWASCEETFQTWMRVLTDHGITA